MQRLNALVLQWRRKLISDEIVVQLVHQFYAHLLWIAHIVFH